MEERSSFGGEPWDFLPAVPLLEESYDWKGENAFLYLRYSAREPGGEADSIGNQRMILHRFLRDRKEFEEYHFGELADDGYTGTNFDRPAARRLFDLILKGKVRCVIVRDFSRFCRNHVALGSCLEQLFPALGVRFVSVMDGYDSRLLDITAAGGEIACRGFFHEFYSRDIAAKVRAMKNQQMKEGKYIGPYAPYGFCKDKENPGRLVPDPVTAPVVKMMYEWEAAGWSDERVAMELNRRKIPSPRKYMVEKEAKERKEEKKKKSSAGQNRWRTESCYWEKSTVASIVKAVRNIGHTQTHRWYRPIAGSRKFRKVPVKEQYLVKNTHQPLVSTELYFLANQRRRGIASVGKKSESNVWMPKNFRCTVCGRRMMCDREEDGNVSYYCNRAHYMPDGGCPAGKIRREAVLAVLWETGKKQLFLAENFSLYLQNSERKKAERKKEKMQENTESTDESKENLSGQGKKCSGKIQPAKQQKDREFLALYEKYQSGKISKEVFLQEKNTRQEEEKNREAVAEKDKKAEEENSGFGQEIREERNSDRGEKEDFSAFLDSLIREIDYIGEKEIHILFRFRLNFFKQS